MYEMVPRHLAEVASIPGIVVEYAGFRRRLFARMLDWIILGVVSAIISYVSDKSLTSFVDSESSDAELVAAIGIQAAISLAISFLYFSLFTASVHQATPGKRAFGIYVTDYAGYRISYGRSMVRVFANVLTDLTFFIGYLMQRFTRRRQALHDKIAGTLVLSGHYQTTVPLEDWRRSANQIPFASSSNTRWVTGSLIGAPVALVLCAFIGIFAAVPAFGRLTDYFNGNAQTVISDMISQQVGDVFDAASPGQTAFRLDSIALDINNVLPINETDFGVDHINGQAYIYGFDTVIDGDGVAIWADKIMYRGMPYVADGQIRFDQVDRGEILHRFMLSPEAIDNGLEDGINRALAQNDLIAVDVSVANGVMIIFTEPEPGESIALGVRGLKQVRLNAYA